GKWLRGRSFGQGQELDPALTGEIVALDRWSGAAEHADGTCALRPEQGHVTSLITHALFLFEGCIVLFVDHDHTERLHGREESRACADGKGQFCVSELAPRSVSRSIAEPAVEDRNCITESPAEPRNELRC